MKVVIRNPMVSQQLVALAGLAFSVAAWTMPVDRELFKQYSATRDRSLGSKLYENADMVVFSQHIEPATGRCNVFATSIQSDDYEQKLHAWRIASSEHRDLAAKNELAQKPVEAKLREVYQQKIDRLPRVQGYAEAKRDLENELRTKTYELYRDAKSNLPPSPQPPPMEEAITVNISEVTLLLKNKTPTEPIIDTETPFDTRSPFEGGGALGAIRVPTKRVLSVAKGTYLPIVDKLCANIDRLHVRLGFYAFVRGSADKLDPSTARVWAPLLMPLVKSQAGWEVRPTALPDDRIGWSGKSATIADEMEDWGNRKSLVWEEVSEAELSARRRVAPTGGEITAAILREHQQLSGANVNFKTGLIENAYFGGAYVRKVNKVDHINCTPIKDGYQCRFRIAGEAYYTNSGGAAILRAMMESSTGSSVEKTEGTVTRQFVLTKEGWRSPDEAGSIRAQQEENTKQMIKGAAAGMCAFANPNDIWAAPGCR